jgi:cell division protein ZapA
MIVKTVPVTIMDKKFTIRSEADEQYIHNVVEYINRQIGSVRSANKNLSIDQAAILACLNIADELHRTKDAFKSFQSETISRSQRILEHVRDVMHENPDNAFSASPQL